MPSNISNEAPRSALSKTGQPHLEAGGRSRSAGRRSLVAGATIRRQPEPLFMRFPELKLYGVPFSRQHLDTLEREGRFPGA